MKNVKVIQALGEFYFINPNDNTLTFETKNGGCVQMGVETLQEKNKDYKKENVLNKPAYLLIGQHFILKTVKRDFNVIGQITLNDFEDIKKDLNITIFN